MSWTKRLALVAVIILALSGSSFAQQPPATAAAGGPATGSAPSVASSDYVLGVGDKLRITTFGEDDLTGEFQVSSTGVIAMPLIGEVRAAGQTVSQVHAAIVSSLSTGYMKDPRVNIEVLTYRPFFIVGEVMKPGSYNYVNGMTVINAVALAGGYTYRADKDDLKLKHSDSNGETKVEEATPVMPGDVVNVPERFF